MSSSRSDQDWIVLETLNGRVLVFRPCEMQRIWLLDDGSPEPTNDFVLSTDFNDYAGLPVDVYGAMVRWAEDCGFDELGQTTRQAALAAIEFGKFENRPAELRSLILDTVLHFTDATSTGYEADSRDLADCLNSIDDPDVSMIKISAAEDDFECYHPLRAPRMIDMPALAIADQDA